MTNEELINQATITLNPYKTPDGRLHGDVAAAVLGKNGKTYSGVCVDTAGWGLCAERSALAAMITEGEYQIDKVVAVWKDVKTEKIHTLPPCGICREFMRQIDQGNLEAKVILGRDNSKTLRDLIPNNEWPDPLD